MSRYSSAEIKAANDTDLTKLLSSLGYHVRRAGRVFTTDEMDSLRIWDRRSWYRYSEGVGGDAIAFLRHFHGLSFDEAVRCLLDFNGYPSAAVTPLVRRKKPPSRQERPAFVLPPKHTDSARVRAYLSNRGISNGVIDSFIRRGLLYEGAKYHDCIFVGYDMAGKPVFATRRSTYGNFKGDVAGSDKRIAFRCSCGSVPDSIFVFKAPIDLMSWLTLHGQSSAIALCGLHDAPLETYLNEKPQIKRVLLCLDADEWGLKATERLEAKYRALGYDVAKHTPKYGKDWNEYLQSRGML